MSGLFFESLNFFKKVRTSWENFQCIILPSDYCNLSKFYSFLVIVATPTQPQFNSKVGFDTKMTLHHNHISCCFSTSTRNLTSAISQLLLTQFWPHFKCRFLVSITSIKTTTIIITRTKKTTITTTSTTVTFHLILTRFWPNFKGRFLDQQQ